MKLVHLFLLTKSNHKKHYQVVQVAQNYRPTVYLTECVCVHCVCKTIYTSGCVIVSYLHPCPGLAFLPGFVLFSAPTKTEHFVNR